MSTPPDLARIQADFGWNALAPDAGAPPALAGAIEPAGVPVERRLAIHRNHFATTLTEALGGVFEATRALLGAEYFDGAALAFARAAPPEGPCLFEYGAGFPAWLADAPGMAERSFAVTLARLEWAMHESFHAPAAAPLQPTRLAAVPSDRLGDVRLTLAPSLKLFAAPFPADTLWRQVGADAVSPDVLEGGPVHLMLLRPDLDVQMERVDPGRFALLHAIAGGATLGEAVEAAVAAADDFDFGEVLGACLAGAVFVDEVTFGTV